MSENDEIKKLKEEIEKLKKELEKLKKQQYEEEYEIPVKRKRPRTIAVGLGSIVGDFVEELLEGIMGEIEKTIFVGPRGVIVTKGRRKLITDFDEKEAAKILEALANENRLKILKSLSRRGKYLKELQEELPDISAGTLSNHLNILEEAGLVVQEAVRGRYLITLPGRFALKMISNLMNYMGEFYVED